MVYVLALMIFGTAVVGMSLGVMFCGRSIRGSCGGLSNIRSPHGKMACDACPSGGQGCHDTDHGDSYDHPCGSGGCQSKS
jgi:hypothetical protein